MSARPRAADLREALIAETLDEVAHLHDTVQALAPKLQTMADPVVEAIAEAATRAQQAITDAATQAQLDIRTHAREQATYVEQAMLRDREKFITEQKASLEALDSRLRIRDAAVAKIMTDILEKSRATFAEEMTQAVKEHTNQGAYNPDQRPKKAKNWAALRALALGIAVGSMGTMGTIIILLRLGVVGVVGAGQ